MKKLRHCPPLRSLKEWVNIVIHDQVKLSEEIKVEFNPKRIDNKLRIIKELIKHK